MGNLRSLYNLNISNNQLTTIPSSIGTLSNLPKLDLLYNPFSKEEKEKVRSLLPKCEIRF